MLAPELAPVLTQIYNQCLQTGKCLESPYVNIITPIHKGGLNTDPLSFRPISLTNVSSKIMEKVILAKMITHIEEMNYYDNDQYAFRQGRNCFAAIL